MAHLPPLEEVLRRSLVEQRYLKCGKPNCNCARGPRHGPLRYLTVTLGLRRTSADVVPPQQVELVRQWIGYYHQVNEGLERTSAINRELLLRERES